MIRIYIILFIIFSPYSLVPVHANVPTLIQITVSQKETDTIITLIVNHLNPSSVHYIDTIEVEINGVIQRIEKLQPQSQPIFSYEFNAGKIESLSSVRARANCNLHGWSEWYSLAITTTSSSTATATTTITSSTTTMTSTSQPIEPVITLATVNLLVQIILMTAIAVGVIHAKKKKFKVHHNYMTVLILINAVTIFIVMGPSLISLIGHPSRTITFATTTSTIHVLLGGITEVLGLIIIFKKPKNLKIWMRTIFTLWMTSFVLGIVLYAIFYMS